MAPWLNHFEERSGKAISATAVPGGTCSKMTCWKLDLHLCSPPLADCKPPCQNRGSCSRPHTCVCRSGFQGSRCEELAPEQVYIRDGGSLRRVQPGTNPFQRDQPWRRPSATHRVQAPQPAATRQPLHAVWVIQLCFTTFFYYIQKELSALMTCALFLVCFQHKKRD